MPSRLLASGTGLDASDMTADGLFCSVTPTIFSLAPSALARAIVSALDSPMSAAPDTTVGSRIAAGPPGVSVGSRPSSA